MTIEHREKIGIGLWDIDAKGTALNDVDRASFAWHYTWRAKSLWDADATPETFSFVPMIWGESHLTADSFSHPRLGGDDAPGLQRARPPQAGQRERRARSSSGCSSRPRACGWARPR